MDYNLYEAWKQVVDTIKSYNDVNAAQVDAFFGRLVPQAISDGYLLVTAESEFFKSQVERRFSDSIRRALMDVFGIEFFVEIEVDPSQAAQQPVATSPVAVPVTPVYAQQPQPQPRPAERTQEIPVIQPNAFAPAPARSEPFDPAEPLRPEKREFDSLASNLTFENFVIGDSNRLAYSMALAVAENPGRQSHLSPLFIYGRSGLGKTHLLRAIQNYVMDTNPTMRVIYVDASEFVAEYAAAGAEHDKNKSSYQNFTKKYMTADMLLIDDVQSFQGKPGTIDVVFQLFNKLTERGRQVVLSADRAPKSIDIDERYKTRFNSGGTFDIQPPEVETKLGIIKGFIEEYKETENNYDLYISEEIQMYIAEISSSNVRELKSAITKVISQITYFGNPDITLPDVKILLENHFSSGVMKKLSVNSIQHEVEQYYKISHADMIGRKRDRGINNARQVAIYLCRQMLDMPYNGIGKKFGSRDHTTIAHAVEVTEDRLSKDRELQEELEIIMKNIREN